MTNLPVFRWYGTWPALFETGIPRKFSRILARWLQEQRWFLNKEMKFTEVRLVNAWKVSIENELIWWLLIEAGSKSESRTFQVPLVWLPSVPTMPQSIALCAGSMKGVILDAWSWPPFATWVLRLMAGENQARNLTSWRTEELNTGAEAECHTSEYSNSTVYFGKRYFLKALRAVCPGIHPEEEVGKFLQKKEFRHTIPIIAGLAHSPGQEKTSLALLSPYVESENNAWGWLLNAISNGMPIQDLLNNIRLLGQRTAELHCSLGSPSDDEAFRPALFTSSQHQQLWARILQHLQQTNQRLKCLRHPSKQVAGLLREFQSLYQQLHATNMPQVVQYVHRIHGDFHLGQVLKTTTDWLIMDFEGEPLRTLEQRRAKDLAWRDVAGMLRSFDYAHAVLRRENVQTPPELEYVFHQVSDAFLESYMKTMGQASEGLALKCYLPLYLLGKALYEIEYEIKSRPEWLAIPLEGTVQLLRGMVKSETRV